MTEDGLDVVFSAHELSTMNSEHARLALEWVRLGTDRAIRWACTVEPGAYLYHHCDAARGVPWHPYVVGQAKLMLATRGLTLVDDGEGLVVAPPQDGAQGE